MAWYRCMGDNSTGLSTLVAKPYNVVNGNYSTNNNVVTYNITPASGYEGMSVQLVNLETDKEYLITFDVLLTGLLGTLANNYSWKIGIKDGTLTQYAGDYGNKNLYNGELYLPKTNSEKKSFSFYVKPQSSTTTLYFCTSDANSNLTLVIDNFKYVNRDVVREQSGGSKSHLEPMSSNESLINIDTDSRFEITFSDANYTWEYKNLFTYDGHNMYSVNNTASLRSNTVSALIKNVGEKSVLMKIYYKSSTESESYDYGMIVIGQYVYVDKIGGSVEGSYEIAIPVGISLTVAYHKDGSGTGGLDNVGFAFYEIGGE